MESGQEYSQAGPLDLAEHVEQAMRESGTLPRWRIADGPAPEPIRQRAVLELACGLRVHAEEDRFAPRVFLTVPHHGRTQGMDMAALVRFLPGYLAAIFEAAAEELRQIAAHTPRAEP